MKKKAQKVVAQAREAIRGEDDSEGTVPETSPAQATKTVSPSKDDM